MSLQFDGVGDYAAATGFPGSTYEATCGAWYRTGDTTAGREIMRLHRNNAVAYFRVVNSTTIESWVASAQRATWTIAQNTWYYLTISNSANSYDVIARVFDTSGNEIAVASGSNTWNGGSYARIAEFVLGNNDAYGDSALGYRRYARYWTRIQTQSQMAAEAAMTPSSGTPAASTTNLWGSWGLPDGTTTTDWSGGSHAITISGGATGSEEPTIGGGSSGGTGCRFSPARPQNLGRIYSIGGVF